MIYGTTATSSMFDSQDMNKNYVKRLNKFKLVKYESKYGYPKYKIELTSLDDLNELIREFGNLVIGPDLDDPQKITIKIYDDCRE